MKMPAALIREEILKSGAISFARFMELALYCPETGYYEGKKDNVGRGGDFITSVSAGSLFGELLAWQFAEWLQEFPIADCRLPIVEAGAHDGQLTKDILVWLQTHRARLFDKIEYVIVEPSPRRQVWQRETLNAFSGRVRWLDHFDVSANQRFNGVIFSNELLDAFPVHRHGWDAVQKKWFEWGVALEEEKFVWTRMPTGARAARPRVEIGVEEDHPKLWTSRGDEARTKDRSPPSLSDIDEPAGAPPALASPSSIFSLPSSLLDVLPDGYTIETSPAAEAWWRQAAEALTNGKLLTIDYGLTDAELFSPARTRGTLRAYYRHHLADDPLASPGEQDLTAHVNFDAIRRVGETAGLKTEQFCTQPQFLTRILQNAVATQAKPFARLDAKQVRQFQTLTHPEHLGRAFRVLVQSRQSRK
jgi:SAM-dependent MidA family methyltransferase